MNTDLANPRTEDSMTNTDIRQLATAAEFSDLIGITTQHAAQMRHAGTGPAFIKITGRQVRYRWEDIEAWLESRTRTRTTAGNAIAAEIEAANAEHRAAGV